MSSTTTKTTYESTSAAQPITPVWVRVPDAMILSGISRSGLYGLFDTSGGPIKTSCLKSRGKTRGIRLINRQSLLGFIESCSLAGMGGAK